MEELKHICKYCKKEFKSGQSLGAHITHCKENPNNHINDFAQRRTNNAKLNNPLLHYKLMCIICGNEYEIDCLKNNFERGNYKHTCSINCSHQLSVKNTNIEEKNKKISKNSNSICTFKGCHNINGVWVKDENYIDPSLPRNCLICGKQFFPKKLNNGTYSIAKFCSDQCRSIFLSNNAREKQCGGIKPNAYKKYKSGLYHGIHCDSSWELAFVIYCEEHNIKIERNKNYLTYIFNNQEFKYYPDFIINDQLYEIKGYENDKAKEKHKQHPEVIYLDKYKMKKYVDYVVNKYGKDFIKLYDRLDKIPD